MKLNKTNKFNQKLEKFDFSGKLKLCAIISLALILIGTLIVSIFGFNLGIDFAGGKVVNVKVGQVLEEGNNYSVVSSQIDKIFNQNGYKITYIQQEGIGEEKQIIIKFEDKSDLTDSKVQEKFEALTTDLETKLSINNETLNVTVSNVYELEGIIKNSTVLKTIIAVLVGTILIMVYICIRFKSFALTAVLTLVHNLLLMGALVAIFRVKVNANILVGVIATLVYSIINIVTLIHKIKENKKKETYENLSRKELSNVSVRHTFSAIMLTAIIIILLSLITMTGLKGFLLPVIFGVLVSVYSTTMLTGSIWAFIGDKISKNKKG